jgi:hypothetical protein
MFDVALDVKPPSSLRPSGKWHWVYKDGLLWCGSCFPPRGGLSSKFDAANWDERPAGVRGIVPGGWHLPGLHRPQRRHAHQAQLQGQGISGSSSSGSSRPSSSGASSCRRHLNSSQAATAMRVAAGTVLSRPEAAVEFVGSVRGFG